MEKDSLVVDVGGGIGSTTRVFAKAFPHLRFVVQDRLAVVAEGIQVCSARHQISRCLIRPYHVALGDGVSGSNN